MKKLLKNLSEIQKKTKQEYSIVLNSDGSGVLIDFWSRIEVYHFDSETELFEFLKTGQISLK